ncbi:MAG: M1 family metallopeptidase [Thermoanaerobaculia bacterium]
MKNRSVQLLCLALFASATGAALAAEPPTFRLPEGARPVHMAVDLTLLPEQETFDGLVVLDVELLRPTRLLWLNGQRLEIGQSTLTVGGKSTPATFVDGGTDFVGFDFGREVAAGRATLEIAYRGKLDPVETEGLFRQKDGESWYAFSQFESTFARRAFPCFDEPAFRTPWKVTLHVRNGQKAYSNSPQIGERAEADDMKAVEFAETPPISSYLVAVAVGPFVAVDAGTAGLGSTPLRIIVPNGLEDRTSYAVEATGPIVEELEKYFGMPYPFPKLDSLAIPHTVGFGAMENPGLITYVDSYLVFDPSEENLSRKQRYAETGAHEIAHQWFGDLVTMKWWDDIWLNEGFATWMAQKVVAGWKPEWGVDEEVASRRSEAMNSDSLPSSQPVRRPIADSGDIVSAFDGISYEKGGALLSMFEGWMGEEKFRSGIRGYLKKHSWGNATSDDLLAALAVEGGPAVARSFASFLDQPGFPVVSAALDCSGKGSTVALAQRRYVPLGSAVSTDARWPVPLNVLYGSGDRIESTRIVVDQAKQKAALEFCPEWIQLNDGGVGYYVTELEGPLFAAFAKRAPSLPHREQIAFLDDISFLFGSGELQATQALGVIPSLANSTNRRVYESVLDLALKVEDNYFDEKYRPNYERYLRKTFGDRARQLGFDPRPGESVDDTLLRPRVLRAVGDAGADPALRAEARRRTEAFLADPKAVGSEMLPTVLRLAAVEGDVALFDRLVAAAEAQKDRRTRQQILRSLGAFRDPAAVEKALQMILSGKFDIREVAFIFFGLSGDRSSRETVLPWVEANYDKLLAAMPEQYTAALSFTGVSFCDAAHRREIETFFGPRSAKLTSGTNNVERALDMIDVCIGRKATLGKGVEQFLAPY